MRIPRITVVEQLPQNNGDNDDDDDDDRDDDANLRELFYDRNPGDARVKVGSERKVASSPRRPNRGVAEIACFISGLRAEGPSKIGLLIWIFSLKKIPISS